MHACRSKQAYWSLTASSKLCKPIMELSAQPLKAFRQSWHPWTLCRVLQVIFRPRDAHRRCQPLHSLTPWLLAGTSTASAATSYASGVEDGKCVGAPLNATGIVAAVVSVTFNRKKYLQQHMDSVLAVHGLHASNRYSTACWAEGHASYTPGSAPSQPLNSSLFAQQVHDSIWCAGSSSRCSSPRMAHHPIRRLQPTRTGMRPLCQLSAGQHPTLRPPALSAI